MKKNVLIAAALLCVVGCSFRPSDGIHTLHLLSSNDTHGTYFDSTYVGNQTRPSFFALKYNIDSVRTAVGEDNVLLLDIGDALQGDNAAYYFNYKDTLSAHLLPRLLDYSGYDAYIMGNHDVETGHPVYDRIRGELEALGIPLLGGNAIRNDNGEPYFPYYTTFVRSGLKVAVLGYTNANISAWLDESLWSGMTFKSLLPLVQEDVDKVIAKEKPQLVIVAAHTATGKGDGSILEAQGLDLFKSLKGVDFVVCAHDHLPVVMSSEDGSVCLLNSGSHSRNLAHGVIQVEVKNGKVLSKKLSADLIPTKAEKVDEQMKNAFRADYEKVQAFTLREVGELDVELRSRDAYVGMCDMMNLIHTVCLESTGAQICFAAPLTFDGKVAAGKLVFNDMFTIYKFENQLFTLKMKGSEIKNYLEYSYDAWIQIPTTGNPHLLKIVDKENPRYSTHSYSFLNASYNFDSASGLNYTVDVTRPAGSRVNITSLADGSAFDFDGEYTVAMTSYRASGGGDLIRKGAALSAEQADARIQGKYPEIRDLIYNYISKHGRITHELISSPELLGSWSFIPENVAGPALSKDMSLLFPE